MPQLSAHLLNSIVWNIGMRCALYQRNERSLLLRLGLPVHVSRSTSISDFCFLPSKAQGVTVGEIRNTMLVRWVQRSVHGVPLIPSWLNFLYGLGAHPSHACAWFTWRHCSWAWRWPSAKTSKLGHLKYIDNFNFQGPFTQQKNTSFVELPYLQVHWPNINYSSYKIKTQNCFTLC